VFSYTFKKLVDRSGIEPLPERCKRTVLPLSLTAHLIGGTLGRIRTDTLYVLSVLSLPIGVRGHILILL
jgi:hypothetical protein